LQVSRYERNLFRLEDENIATPDHAIATIWHAGQEDVFAVLLAHSLGEEEEAAER
jgi:hypothetical protein